jgi:hypothetical protein
MATIQQQSSPDREDLVRSYKTILKTILDHRPSGIRLRIAERISRNKSFVSQVTNPTYKTPLPERHIETIFEVAAFTAEERAQFLRSYREAHPEGAPPAARPRPAKAMRRLCIDLPRFGKPDEEARVDQLVSDFARRINELAKNRG